MASWGYRGASFGKKPEKSTPAQQYLREKAALDAARKVLVDAKALVDAKHADATRKLLMSQTSERAADISRQTAQDLWAALPPKVRREAEANLELLKDYKARGI